VIEGKGNKYRLIPMNFVVRGALMEAIQDRSPAGLVFDANYNGVNRILSQMGLRRSMQASGDRLRRDQGRRNYRDLRRTFTTRLRANGVHEYDIQDLLGHAKPGVTKVYARATLAVLEEAVKSSLSHGAK